MKNVVLSVLGIGSLVCLVSCGSSKQVEYKYSAKADPVEEIVREYKTDGYRQESMAFTMYELIKKHREKLQSNENLVEIYGEGEGLTSSGARQEALNAAAIAYATAAGSIVSGKMEREFTRTGKEKFEMFHGAYIQDVSKFVMPLLKESMAFLKTDPTDSSQRIKIAFLLDEDKARNARNEALNNALKKSELGQEFGQRIRDYVNEKVQPNQE